MYAMRPLRPTAIATPGATASSSAVFTILSSTDGSEVSSPELLSPICGGRYWIGGGAATTRAGGGGGAQAAAPTSEISRRAGKEGESFIDWTSGSVLDEYRPQTAEPEAAKLAGAR